MEISKFISEALKDGSIDKVSKGIEQLVMMMINAIGMIEKRELEFEKRLETLEEDIDLIKSFLLSKPIPFPNSTKTSSNASISPSQSQYPSTERVDQNLLSEEPFITSAGPQEEDIIDFRKKMLHPTPKHEKVAKPPVSIRAALMQEMKDYFGNAMNKVKKEKKSKKTNPISE